MVNMFINFDLLFKASTSIYCKTLIFDQSDINDIQQHIQSNHFWHMERARKINALFPINYRGFLGFL